MSLNLTTPQERDRRDRERERERGGRRGREVCTCDSGCAMRNMLRLKYNLTVGSLLFCGSQEVSLELEVRTNC